MCWGDFYQEWVQVIEEFSLVFADIVRLPVSSYTHVNNASLTKSWLDHCLVSESVFDSLSDIKIDYNYFGSDHFPIYASLRFDFSSSSMESETAVFKEKIRWNFNNENKTRTFYDILLYKLLDLNLNFCRSQCCNNGVHMHQLDLIYHGLVEAVKESGLQVFGTCDPKYKTVPGWNLYVKEAYQASRESFLAWRRANSPPVGFLAEHMRLTRAHFKYVLKQCKRNENQILAEEFARKFRQGDMSNFWRDIKSLNTSKPVSPRQYPKIIFLCLNLKKLYPIFMANIIC